MNRVLGVVTAALVFTVLAAVVLTVTNSRIGVFSDQTDRIQNQECSYICDQLESGAVTAEAVQERKPECISECDNVQPDDENFRDMVVDEYGDWLIAD